jgi:hypothetical protein
MKKLVLAIGAISMMSTGVALAATDGAIGLSSTGTVDISVNKGNVVRVSALVDFITPVWSVGDGDINQTQNVCVYANNAGGDYQVRLTSGNALGPQWRLSNGLGDFIAYAVAWVDSAGGTFAGSTAGPGFGSGVLSVNQDNGDQNDPDCGGGPTATLALEILSGNLTPAPNGSYTDTLTVTVTPN